MSKKKNKQKNKNKNKNKKLSISILTVSQLKRINFLHNLAKMIDYQKEITILEWIIVNGCKNNDDHDLFNIKVNDIQCKINKRSIDQAITDIYHEGNWVASCKWKKYSDRVDLEFNGYGVTDGKYYVSFSDNELIGSSCCDKKKFSKVLNGKFPPNIKGFRKKLSAEQIAKINKKEPTQTQQVAKKETYCLKKDFSVIQIYNGSHDCGSRYLTINEETYKEVEIIKDEMSFSIAEKSLLQTGKFPLRLRTKIEEIYIQTQIAKKEPKKEKKVAKKKKKKKKQVVKSDDLLGDLKALTALYESGVLTEEQFIKGKEKLLGTEGTSEVAKTQEEFEPSDTADDTEPPVLKIAEAITVDDPNYTLTGEVSDKGSKKLYVQVEGALIPVKKGKFSIERFSPVDEEVEITAIDQWGNKTSKVVKVKVEVKEVVLVRKFESLDPSKLKNRADPNKVAVIIGIENYDQAPKADYANRDAQYFYEYATRGFGVKPENINLLIDENATLVQSLTALSKWLPGKIKKDKTELILFFSGHGLASPDGKELYLLSQDSDTDLLNRTAILRTDIFNDIKNSQPKSVMIFFDTCYSGFTRDNTTLLASARPVRILASDDAEVPDNFTIFSASQLDQVSSSLDETKHGIFSYYLMKGLEGKADNNKDKKITNGELLAYMDENVSQIALELGRQQKPSLIGGKLDQVLMKY